MNSGAGPPLGEGETRVFIGRLPDNADRTELESIFSQYGPIKSWTFGHRNFAFVEYYDHHSAALAVNKSGSIYLRTHPHHPRLDVAWPAPPPVMVSGAPGRSPWVIVPHPPHLPARSPIPESCFGSHPLLYHPHQYPAAEGHRPHHHQHHLFPPGAERYGEAMDQLYHGEARVVPSPENGYYAPTSTPPSDPSVSPLDAPSPSSYHSPLAPVSMTSLGPPRLSFHHSIPLPPSSSSSSWSSSSSSSSFVGHPQAEDGEVEDPPSTTLYIKNLSYQITEGDIKEKLESLGAKDGLKAIRWITDKLRGYFTGEAFIEYETIDAANLAMDRLRGRRVMGRRMKITYAKPKKKPHTITMFATSGGREPKEEKRPKYPGCKTIFIAKLDDGITEAMLKDIFGTFGEIQRVYRLLEPGTKQFKGCAFICYSCPKEAEQAVKQMDGVRLFGKGRFIDVNFADKPGPTPQAVTMPVGPLPLGINNNFPSTQPHPQTVPQKKQQPLVAPPASSSSMASAPSAPKLSHTPSPDESIDNLQRVAQHSLSPATGTGTGTTTLMTEASEKPPVENNGGPLTAALPRTESPVAHLPKLPVPGRRPSDLVGEADTPRADSFRATRSRSSEGKEEELLNKEPRERSLNKEKEHAEEHQMKEKWSKAMPLKYRILKSYGMTSNKEGTSTPSSPAPQIKLEQLDRGKARHTNERNPSRDGQEPADAKEDLGHQQNPTKRRRLLDAKDRGEGGESESGDSSGSGENDVVSSSTKRDTKPKGKHQKRDSRCADEMGGTNGFAHARARPARKRKEEPEEEPEEEEQVKKRMSEIITKYDTMKDQNTAVAFLLNVIRNSNRTKIEVGTAWRHPTEYADIYEELGMIKLPVVNGRYHMWQLPREGTVRRIYLDALKPAETKQKKKRCKKQKEAERREEERLRKRQRVARDVVSKCPFEKENDDISNSYSTGNPKKQSASADKVPPPKKSRRETALANNGKPPIQRSQSDEAPTSKANESRHSSTSPPPSAKQQPATLPQVVPTSATPASTRTSDGLEQETSQQRLHDSGQQGQEGKEEVKTPQKAQARGGQKPCKQEEKEDAREKERLKAAVDVARSDHKNTSDIKDEQESTVKKSDQPKAPRKRKAQASANSGGHMGPPEELLRVLQREALGLRKRTGTTTTLSVRQETVFSVKEARERRGEPNYDLDREGKREQATLYKNEPKPKPEEEEEEKKKEAQGEKDKENDKDNRNEDENEDDDDDDDAPRQTSLQSRRRRARHRASASRAVVKDRKAKEQGRKKTICLALEQVHGGSDDSEGESDDDGGDHDHDEDGAEESAGEEEYIADDDDEAED